MQYIKNVTNHHAKKAYMDCEGIFKLHFNHQPNEEKINLGENILICQRLGESEVRVFSHLVVIIDQQVHQDKEKKEYDHYIYVKLITKSKKGFSIRNTKYWKDIEHGGYSSGRLVNIKHLKQVQNEDTLRANLEKEVWDLFFPNLEENYEEEIIRIGKTGMISIEK